MRRTRDLFDDEPHRRSRREHPDTSHEGARTVPVAQRRVEFLRILAAHGPLTQSEADRQAGYTGRVLGKRANEVVDLGYAETLDKRICEVSGRKAYPYRLTAAGWELLAALEVGV